MTNCGYVLQKETKLIEDISLRKICFDSDEEDISEPKPKKVMVETDYNNSHDLPVPNDVLRIILQFFQLNEESFFVGLVCKRWNSIIKRDKTVAFPTIVRYYAKLGNLESVKCLLT